jgi:hypothetical protein
VRSGVCRAGAALAKADNCNNHFEATSRRANLLLNLGETKSVAPRFLEKAGIFEFLHRQRKMNMSEKLIISDPAVMMGKPVIKGTRITVELILEKL